MAVELNLLNSNSLNNIGVNFERVRTALQDVLGRSGTLPNHMNADLDLNSNDLLNVNIADIEELYVNGNRIGDVGWIVGNGAPSPSIGLPGQIYLDRLSGNVYGPKTSVWGLPIINIMGPKGEKGDLTEDALVILNEMEQLLEDATQLATPGDNTVSTPKIVDAAVSIEKTDGTFATITASDVPELLSGVIAAKTLSYTAGEGNLVVVPGQIVRTRKEGFICEVASSDATEFDEETAGGVKLSYLADVVDKRVPDGAGIQSSKLNYNRGVTGAQARTLKDRYDQSLVSLLEFASGGPETVDDSVWQYWWDYINSAGKTGVVPAGEYDKGVTLAHDGSVFVLGEGRKLSTINHLATTTCFTIDGGGSYIQNGALAALTILGDSDPVAHTGTSGNGLYLNDVSNNWSFYDLDIRQCNNGLFASDSFTQSFFNCRFQHNRVRGVHTQSASNNMSFFGCVFNYNGTDGFSLSGSQNNVFGGNAEGNGQRQGRFSGRAGLCHGMYFERIVPGFAALEYDGCIGGSVDGCYFNDAGGPGGAGDLVGVQMINSTKKVIVHAGNMFHNNSGVFIPVRCQSSTNNNFAWLEGAESFVNNGQATNKKITQANF